MKRVFVSLAVALMTAFSAEAASFRLQDITGEQECGCDCVVTLSRTNAAHRRDNLPPVLIEITGEYGQARVDGRPLTLRRTENLTSANWYVYENADADVRVEPYLRNDGRHRTGYLRLVGDVRVRHKGESVTVRVIGTDFCDHQEQGDS